MNSTPVANEYTEVIAVDSNDKFVMAKQRDIGSESISYFYVRESRYSTYLNRDEITQEPACAPFLTKAAPTQFRVLGISNSETTRKVSYRENWVERFNQCNQCSRPLTRRLIEA